MVLFRVKHNQFYREKKIYLPFIQTNRRHSHMHLCIQTCFQRVAHVEKSVSMQQHCEQFVGKQRRFELKSVGNIVAKTVMVESANQFPMEELCSRQYNLKYYRSHIVHQTVWKNLQYLLNRLTYK